MSNEAIVLLTVAASTLFVMGANIIQILKQGRELKSENFLVRHGGAFRQEGKIVLGDLNALIEITGGICGHKWVVESPIILTSGKTGDGVARCPICKFPAMQNIGGTWDGHGSIFEQVSSDVENHKEALEVLGEDYFA